MRIKLNTDHRRARSEDKQGPLQRTGGRTNPLPALRSLERDLLSMRAVYGVCRQ